jgi:chromate transporter
VPFLREGVVHQHHWLDQRQFLDAVAMGCSLPARWSSRPPSSATWSAGWPAPWWPRWRSLPPSTWGWSSLGAGLCATATTPRSRPSSRARPPRPPGAIAGATVVLTRQAITDWPTAAIALVGLGLLWRLVVVAGALAGLLLH